MAGEITPDHWDFDRDTPLPGSLWQDTDGEWMRVIDAPGNRVGPASTDERRPTLYRFTAVRWYGDAEDEPNPDDEEELSKGCFTRTPRGMSSFVPAAFPDPDADMPHSHWNHALDRPREGSVWQMEGHRSRSDMVIIEEATDNAVYTGEYQVYVRVLINNERNQFVYRKGDDRGVPSYEPCTRPAFSEVHWTPRTNQPRLGSLWVPKTGHERDVARVVAYKSNNIVVVRYKGGRTADLYYNADPREIPVWRPFFGQLDDDPFPGDDGDSEDAATDQGADTGGVLAIVDETLSDFLARLNEEYDDA